MEEIRFGIIGLGTVADFHIEAIKSLDGCKLTAVSSRSESRAREVGEKENCAWTFDYHKLLKRTDVDIVCVTTSSGTHAMIGMDVLRACKHLVVEKPIAMTARQAVQLTEEAQSRKLLLSVISQRRFETQHQAVKRVIQEGKLGRLLMAEVNCPYYRTQDYYDSSPWRGTISDDGGALMNQAIHSIDLLLWLVGEPVASVFGKRATLTHRMEAEDMGLALLEFSGGALGRIFASTSILPGFAPTFSVYGEYGSILLEGSQVKHWSVPGIDAPEGDASAGSGGGINDPTHISWELHRRQLHDIADSLRMGRLPAVTGQDGARSVKLIEDIYLSAQTGTDILIT